MHVLHELGAVVHQIQIPDPVLHVLRGLDEVGNVAGEELQGWEAHPGLTYRVVHRRSRDRGRIRLYFRKVHFTEV